MGAIDKHKTCRTASPYATFWGGALHLAYRQEMVGSRKARQRPASEAKWSSLVDQAAQFSEVDHVMFNPFVVDAFGRLQNLDGAGEASIV